MNGLPFCETISGAMAHEMITIVVLEDRDAEAGRVAERPWP